MTAGSPFLLAADASVLADEALFDAALRLVPPDRQQKVRRFAVAPARRLSLCAGLLLGEALSRLGIRSYELEDGAYGKPHLKSCPDIHFNLSHSGDYALCAVSTGEIGCDIQQMSGSSPDIARRFFTDAETAAIQAAGDEDAQGELFFRIWSLKESVIKATGQGLRTPLGSFEVLPGTESLVLGEQLYHLREYFSLPGYSCAVCSVLPMDCPEIEILPLSEIIKRQP